MCIEQLCTDAHTGASPLDVNVRPICTLYVLENISKRINDEIESSEVG